MPVFFVVFVVVVKFIEIRSQPEGFCFSNEARGADEFGGAVRLLAELTEVRLVRSSLTGNFHSDYLNAGTKRDLKYYIFTFLHFLF